MAFTMKHAGSYLELFLKTRRCALPAYFKVSITIRPLTLIFITNTFHVEFTFIPRLAVVISGKDFIICKYPKDPTVALGYLSAMFLLASSAAGYFFQFYPYKGNSIPKNKLFESTGFHRCFVNIFLHSLTPYRNSQLHVVRNVHNDLETTCPTAKTGLFGGGALVSLCASLMWLVTLMFAHNARDDYLEVLG